MWCSTKTTFNVYNHSLWRFDCTQWISSLQNLVYPFRPHARSCSRTPSRMRRTSCCVSMTSCSSCRRPTTARRSTWSDTWHAWPSTGTRQACTAKTSPLSGLQTCLGEACCVKAKFGRLWHCKLDVHGFQPLWKPNFLGSKCGEWGMGLDGRFWHCEFDVQIPASMESAFSSLPTTLGEWLGEGLVDK